jgi:hypothetical protein
MIRVRLETRHGDFVHDPIIPAFRLLPEIVGERTFVIHDREKSIYREGIVYYVVMEKENETAFGAAIPRMGSSSMSAPLIKETKVQLLIK